jgi:hypothetical protein
VIVTAHQDILASWLCKRIGIVPSQNIKCIGNMIDDKIVGVVGFDGYNGASVQMHVAGSGNWCTRSMLFATFDYPFRVLKCNVVLGLVPSGNADAINFNLRIGFKIIDEIEGAHPDGSLILIAMRREECRFTHERFGREVRTHA